MNDALTPVLVSGIARISSTWGPGTVEETFTLDASGKIARWYFKPNFVDPPELGMYDTPSAASR